MPERPAATLHHLGPGLGNGLANLHNARKARVPIVNIVGDHATDHAKLQSDIATVARNVSSWIQTVERPEATGRAAGDAVATATGVIEGIAKQLCETFPTRVERGAGVQPVPKIAYFAEAATQPLTGLRHMVLVDAKSPVSFFAYPDKASDLVPGGFEVHTLGTNPCAQTRLTAGPSKQGGKRSPRRSATVWCVEWKVVSASTFLCRRVPRRVSAAKSLLIGAGLMVLARATNAAPVIYNKEPLFLAELAALAGSTISECFKDDAVGQILGTRFPVLEALPP